MRDTESCHILHCMSMSLNKCRSLGCSQENKTTISQDTESWTWYGGWGGPGGRSPDSSPPPIPVPQIYMRFLEYEMHNSNECKRNFVAIYDGSSSVEHLKNKFCSTVANDVMLTSSVGVIRLWADEGSRKSKFRILFTTFLDRKWRHVVSIWKSH